MTWWKKQAEPQENQQTGSIRGRRLQRNLLAAGGSLAALAVIAASILWAISGQSIPAEGRVIPSSLSAFSSESRQDTSPQESVSSESELQGSSSSSAEQTHTEPVSPAAGSSKPQGCSHTFINETVMPSCTTQGYTTHTCSKCGYSYTDAYTAPQHYIGKYLCDYCGAPDPGNPYYSLSAWINTYVPTRDEAGNPNWVYAGPNNASYSITSCQMMSWLLLRYSRMSENGEWESLDIELNDRDQQCTVYYFRRTAAGDYQNGTAVLDRSAVRSPEQLWAAMSVGEEVENDSKEAFLADCSNRMEDVVSTIQNQLLSPQLGFTVDMLGLTA